MKKGKIKIPIEEYKTLRDALLSWDWITESFDSKNNRSVYKLTKKGTQVYATIVNAVGTDRLVNGYKLKLNEIYVDGIVPYGTDPLLPVIKALIAGHILTKSYDEEINREYYELTPYGAKLFVSFFVSLGRDVGTLPGDKTAAFFRIMQKMPYYTQRFSEVMDNIAKGLQAFDKYNNKGGGFGKMDYNYGKNNGFGMGDGDELRKAGERMMNFGGAPKMSTGKNNWKKNWNKTKKSSKTKKSKKSSSGTGTGNGISKSYSDIGRNMMNSFRW